MKKHYLLIKITLSLIFGNSSIAQNIIPSAIDPVAFIPKELTTQIPESIIFIIADGTGLSQYSLSYYTNSNFYLNQFEFIGLVTTHPNDSSKKVTDSAASGTALATGEKTYNGAISVDNNNIPIKTVIEWAEEQEMLTGMVVTSTITHATPACFASHVPSRKMEYEIANQMSKSNIEVLFGGGGKYWTDESLKNFKKNNGIVIKDFNKPIPDGKKVLGLFNEDALFPADKRIVSTKDMTIKALGLLEKNKNGFFLMIEESQVDWAGHANDGNGISMEMNSLNDVIKLCLDYQKKKPNTLVILTSDHECGGLGIDDGKNGTIKCDFTTYYHTASMVPIFATGPGAQYFNQFLDNTDIGKKLIEYVKN